MFHHQDDTTHDAAAAVVVAVVHVVQQSTVLLDVSFRRKACVVETLIDHRGDSQGRLEGTGSTAKKKRRALVLALLEVCCKNLACGLAK